MKTFQIEDAKMRFFKSKEDYLNFKQAWKDYHNSDKLRWYEDVDITFWDAPATQERVFARKKFTSLNASHYMLYNILRGYESRRGFTPIVNEGRLTAHGGSPWYSYDETMGSIIRTARRIEDINSKSEFGRRYAREAVDKMRLPFGNTVTNAMLYEIASELYTHLSGNTLPQIVAEEEKSFGKAATVRKVVKALGRV